MKDGLIRCGNEARLSALWEKGRAGEPLCIAFIGGSITQGARAEKEEYAYAALVFKWFQRTFPTSKCRYVNAGIGATTSQFGAARVKEDVLAFKPDLVFVDFSVNDNDEAPFTSREIFKESYEGLLRQLLYDISSRPAVVLLHNVWYDDGHSEEAMHAALGTYYDVMSISIRQSVYEELLAGHIKIEEISPDALHPNDRGHALLAAVITDVLERQYRKSKTDAARADIFLKEPLTENHYEKIRRWNRRNTAPLLNGFYADSMKQEGVRDVFKNGWFSERSGASVTFCVWGGEIGVMYKKTVQRPAPLAVAVLDGHEEEAVILDAAFAENWGDKACFQMILHHGVQAGLHMLTIRLVTGQKGCPFYLINVIAERVEKQDRK